jgi:hypothetical protein
LIKDIAEKRLAAEHKMTICNPFMVFGAPESTYVTITFKATTNIRVAVYYAVLK